MPTQWPQGGSESSVPAAGRRRHLLDLPEAPSPPGGQADSYVHLDRVPCSLGPQSPLCNVACGTGTWGSLQG